LLAKQQEDRDHAIEEFNKLLKEVKQLREAKQSLEENVRCFIFSLKITAHSKSYLNSDFSQLFE